jgi:isoleucyl-tRNA synthetase
VPREASSARALAGNEMVVSVALELTPALEREGLARDVVRQVQEARKKAGFDVSDHIKLSIGVSHFTELRLAVEEHMDMIAGETLSDDVAVVDGPVADGERATVADGRVFHLRVERLRPKQ